MIIINISSIAGRFRGITSGLSYAYTKSGLLAFTRYLATYWAKKGLRVNCISPAGVYKRHNKKFVEQLSQRIPMGRMANSNEYISAIQFLCSDASAYMNGQNIVIDGGRSVL